jgi:hypothetical protein
MTPSADTPRTGRPLTRVLALTAAIGLVIALAFLVGRPGADPQPVAVNLAAQKGPRPPGLKIFLQRGPDLQILDPTTELRRGDALRFVVRASAPRYLVVRLRDGAGHERVVFPTAGAPAAALVRPDAALPEPLPIDEASTGRQTLTALFGQRPFPVDQRPGGAELEVATVDLPTVPSLSTGGAF